MAWWWCVSLAVLLGGSSAATLSSSGDDPDNTVSQPPPVKEQDEYLLKQVVWKRCYRKITPACLKLNLVRTVELMSKDSSLALVPGVFFTSNTSEFNSLPPDIARSLSSEHAPLDDLVAFTVGKYLRSLTLNVNIVDFVSGGNETLQRSVIDAFSGRARKNGLMGGYGAIAAMMGGMMASMMMAALAALAGKAMMTSLLALIMAAFAAMKGGGGGGGSKTYEVITKPVVSHIDTHSSEVQHEHHGHYHKRSLGLGGDDEREQRMLNQDKVPELKGERVDFYSKPHELKEENNGKEPSGSQEYYLIKNSKSNNKEKEENKFDGSIQNLHYQLRSLDMNDKLNSGNDGNREVQSQPHDFDRFKRELQYSDPTKSTSLASLQSGYFGTTNSPFVGHPRQNHKEYRRNTDDDLLMAFGLFR